MSKASSYAVPVDNVTEKRKGKRKSKGNEEETEKEEEKEKEEKTKREATEKKQREFHGYLPSEILVQNEQLTRREPT